MRVISIKKLRDFWILYPDSERPLRAWYREAKAASWDTPSSIKAQYRSASFPGRERVIFNIKGNDYRLVVKVHYPYEAVYIRWIGTHEDYDSIDVLEV